MMIQHLIKCLNVMLMLDVSEEETMRINVLRSFMFRESLFHYTPRPVRPIIPRILKRC